VNMVMKIWVPQKMGICLISGVAVGFLIRMLLHEVNKMKLVI
jgi:uncharacterized membrane-anchored protein YhcB (DUF1043 family)